MCRPSARRETRPHLQWAAQYRMFDVLSDTISNLFYDGQLINGKADPTGQLCLHTTRGQAEQPENSTSLFNPTEVTRVVEHYMCRSIALGHTGAHRQDLIFPRRTRPASAALLSTERVQTAARRACGVADRSRTRVRTRESA